jgi:LmbE family N-acetylglucosaminyl deacetylase
MTEPSANNRYTPERVMVIAAHPDDIEFLCAGTVARWVRDGAVGCYVLCTSGQVGIKNPALTLDEVAATREREQRAAASKVGVEAVVFLGYQDGILENTMELRRRLVREIRRFRPEVVITQDPTRLFVPRNDYINHPDHRAAAGAAIDAVFPAAGMPHVFQEFEEEGLTAHETRKVYVVAFEEATTWVDISDTLELKLDALMEHDSQIKEMGNWDPRERIREWAASHAKGKEMTFAEGFRVITLKSREDWERCKGHVLPEDCADQPYTDADRAG